VSFFLRLFLAAEAEALRVRVLANSNRSLAFGRLNSFRLQLGRVHRGLQLQRGMLECGALDLGIKPLLLALTPLIALLRPSLLLPVLLLMLFLPGLPPALRRELGQQRLQDRRTRVAFSAELSAGDLAGSSLWRFLLTAGLRDIMEYSVAGLVALPREVSGELSSATSFELETVDIADSRLVMDAVARLPNGTLFKYRLRTGVALTDLQGAGCLFWQDPEIRVSPGWGLPDFWAPIGGFAGRRFSEFLQLSRLDILASGVLLVEGSLGAGTGGAGSAIVPAAGPAPVGG